MTPPSAGPAAPALEAGPVPRSPLALPVPLAAAVRVAGIEPGVPDDLLRRDRVHADLSLRSPRRACRPARRAVRLSDALHVPGGTGLVDRRHGDRLGGRQADRRARDDRGDLSRVRAGALRRLASVGALRGRDHRGRCSAARVRAVPAGRAARLSGRHGRSLVDHGGGCQADEPVGSASRRAICLVAPFVRGELAVLLAVFCRSACVLVWRTERFTRWRSSWTAGDWVGAGCWSSAPRSSSAR